MKPIIIIGTGLSKNDLTDIHKQIISKSDILIGGIRLLEMFDDYFGEKVEISGNIKDIKDLIRKKIDSKCIVVLSSGDPLLFGIGTTLIKEFGQENIVIYPNISSISVAFSRIREPWHNAKIISFHGRKLNTVSIRELFAEGDKFVILTGSKNTPKAVAKCLLLSLQENILNLKKKSGIKNCHINLATTHKQKSIFEIAFYEDFLKNYKFYIFEKLGAIDEKISCYSVLDVAGLDTGSLDVADLDTGSLDTTNSGNSQLIFKEPNIIILKRVTCNKNTNKILLESHQCNHDQQTQVENNSYKDVSVLKNCNSQKGKILHSKKLDFYQGMPEKNFCHKKGLITKPEVRVISLSKLRLLPEHILWDLGAGSGSISVEASLSISHGKIFAVEKNVDRIKDIEKNKKNFNIENLKIIHANLPEKLDNLPTPDRVFIGGGGKNLGKIIEIVSARIKQGDIIVINTVLVGSLDLVVNLFKKLNFSLDVIQLQVSRGKEMPWNMRFESENPVWIICGIKR